MPRILHVTYGDFGQPFNSKRLTNRPIHHGQCTLRSISSLPGAVARSLASTSGTCFCEDISTEIVLCQLMAKECTLNTG